MTFIDSNVLVYSIDDNSPEKQRKARAIVARAIGGRGFMVSAQVLNEFTNVALAKMRLTLPEVGKFVAVFRRIKSVPVDCGWTERALAIKAEVSPEASIHWPKGHRRKVAASIPKRAVPKCLFAVPLSALAS